MKLTLFTISNEQIKEQLSKLQAKVESLETVKDVQDKIISAKDSQITFLQGEISNITSWVTWGAGIVITLASAAFIFIKFLESKAKKKLEETETKLEEIETAKQKTEINLTESDAKIDQLNSLIDKSNNISTIAQEKLDNLTRKQQELEVLSSSLIINQKANVLLNSIKNTLGYVEKTLNILKSNTYESHLKAKIEDVKIIEELSDHLSILKMKHLKFDVDLNHATKKEISISNMEEIINLENEAMELNLRIINYIEKHHGE